ncbi:MAG: 3-keto-5-aminohexanoate cleavage protein [Actinobacteria bacterium]|nr:3-keto-5-aminohexanoate cleavage protein [Actinomycetota bacterium]
MKLPAGKVIVTASLNGAMVTKDMNPSTPEQPDEIAQAALECYNAGAAIVHIHARDEQGKPTGTKEKFEEILAAVRGKCSEIIIQFSTGGGANLTLEERVRCLDALPESASLNMGTLMRQTGAQAGVPFSNMTKDIEAWAAKMRDLNIKPEMECYSQSMYRDVKNLIKKELINPPYYVNMVLGMQYQGAIEATPETLHSMIEFLPEGCYFNCCAVGAAQLPVTTAAMIMGGAVRVGLEDNIYYAKGVLAKSNAQLVERSVRIARELNIEPVSPDEARQILGIVKR